MNLRLVFLILAVTASALSHASAQNQLNTGEIVDSLQGLETAPGNVTAALLRQQALTRIKNHQGDDPRNREPLSEQLNKLPQLTVEINFNLDSAIVRPESYRTLGLMADALHHPYLLEYKFLIIGHTDASGKREYNLNLSQKRADAIREALTTTFRVAPRRVEAVGLGEEQLRNTADPNSAENRRVQLITIGKIN
jgi:OOP family OmpA-OmpF porin